MKTKTTSRTDSARVPDPVQQSSLAGKTPTPRIDFARRQTNRALPTDQLLSLLRTEAPRFYDLAEVVGKWVWIHFPDKQPREVTATLAQLGFHWNNARQTWQHPCGAVTQGSPGDPREKYGTRHAADHQPA